MRLAAEQERTMVLRIDGHAVIEPTALYRIPANDAICQRVNLRHFVCGTQRYINPLRNGIVSGRAGFTVESQNFYNLVLVNVDYADCLTQRIGDVRLSKWLRIGNSIRF